MALGVGAIHGSGAGMTSHQDIKASNVFVNLDQSNEIRDVALGDYGIGNEYPVAHNAGTPGVGAPELFISRAFKDSDIFSLGKLAVLIIFPWEIGWQILSSPDERLKRVIAKYPMMNNFCSIITKMLHVNW